MPAVSVTLNGKFLVSVATDAFTLIDVSVSGDLLGPEHAILRVSGGAYPEGHRSTYLIWEDERVLVPGDAVSVEFSATGTTSSPGKTIEELYGEEECVPWEPPSSPEQLVTEMKQRPKHFSSLAFELVNADGTLLLGQTEPHEHGFGFSVLWNSFRPEGARAALRTYTLDSLVTKENGKYHSNSRLSLNQEVTFRIREAHASAKQSLSSSPGKAAKGIQ